MAKWKDQGYWKSELFYWQSLIYYFYYSAVYRSFTWFSPINEAIPFGGMLAEKKDDIYSLIPPQFLPKTACLEDGVCLQTFLKTHQLSFPLYIKPNIGLKGVKVARLSNVKEATAFDLSGASEWIVQEEVVEKLEFSILYYRDKIEGIAGITSSTSKSYPFVIGDGTNTLGTLIATSSNPYIDKGELYHKHLLQLEEVLPAGTKYVLHQIGNYSRGSKLYNASELINQSLMDGINLMMDDIMGIDFCRIDLKSNSIKDIYCGNYKVLEINGAKSEPLHVYDPEVSFLQAVRDIHQHWMTIKNLVKSKYRQGATFPSTLSGLRSLAGVKSVLRG